MVLYWVDKNAFEPHYTNLAFDTWQKLKLLDDDVLPEVLDLALGQDESWLHHPLTSHRVFWRDKVLLNPQCWRRLTSFHSDWGSEYRVWLTKPSPQRQCINFQDPDIYFPLNTSLWSYSAQHPLLLTFQAQTLVQPLVTSQHTPKGFLQLINCYLSYYLQSYNEDPSKILRNYYRGEGIA